MSIDLAHVNRAPGQAVRECPQCHQALVDTGDGQWNHAIGVEPCGWKCWQPGDRVLVHLQEHRRWRWFPGTVREVNTGSRPGVLVDLDYPVSGCNDCYATHAELMTERLAPLPE